MIQSHWIANNIDGKGYLIFDTVYEHRHFMTAVGVGVIVDNDARLTDTGQATLFALCDHAQAINPGFTVRLQGVTSSLNAGKRLRKALKAANEKDVVFFVCRTDALYDAVFAALSVKFPEGSVQ